MACHQTVRWQAIIWNNAGVSFIECLGRDLNKILIEIRTFSFQKIYSKCRLESGGNFVSA